MQFEIIKGNIINAGTDAVVLPGNPLLKEGPGASSAIFEAAGRSKLTKACKTVLKRIGGKAEVGSAVPTLAFGLNADYIIHAIVPRWIDGNSGEYNKLCSAYLTSLKIADQMECTSIAFPLLASGNNGFDKELAFEIACETFKDYAASSLQKIILIIHGESIASMVKEKGYDYSIEMPKFLADEKRMLHLQKEKHKKKVEDMKEIVKDQVEDAAHGILKDKLDAGLKYLANPENQKLILEKAVGVVKIAVMVLK